MPTGSRGRLPICWPIPVSIWRGLAAIWPELGGIAPEIAEQIEIDGKYAGYLERQEADIRAFRRDEALALPRDLDYASVGSLSTEIRLKLHRRGRKAWARPRVSGVTPAALMALLRHVRRGQLSPFPSAPSGVSRGADRRQGEGSY